MVYSIKCISYPVTPGADPELVSGGGGRAHVERPLPTPFLLSLLPFPSLPSLPYPSLPFPLPSLSPLEEEGPGVLPRKILKF